MANVNGRVKKIKIGKEIGSYQEILLILKYYRHDQQTCYSPREEISVVLAAFVREAIWSSIQSEQYLLAYSWSSVCCLSYLLISESTLGNHFAVIPTLIVIILFVRLGTGSFSCP